MIGALFFLFWFPAMVMSLYTMYRVYVIVESSERFRFMLIWKVLAYEYSIPAGELSELDKEPQVKQQIEAFRPLFFRLANITAKLIGIGFVVVAATAIISGRKW